MIMAETKVIWVHLIWEKKDYFFGSISAIYDVLTEEQIGITKSSLLHAGMRDGSSHLTKRALIKQSRLIRFSLMVSATGRNLLRDCMLMTDTRCRWGCRS